MKRIFIAIKIDAGDTLLNLITSLKTGLKSENIRWISNENSHITLAFLGNIEENNIEIIKAILKKECEGFGKFEIIIRGAGLFKNLNDPRVIWTGIDPSEKLLQLNTCINQGLIDVGQSSKLQPFNPHLTLGRMKNIKDRGMLETTIERYKDTEIQRVKVNEVILYESILRQTGPVYKPISIIKL